MNFSHNQILKLIEIINKNQAVFIGSKLGLEYLSPYQKFLLKGHGIDPDKYKNQFSEIDRAFYFGMIAQGLGGLKSFNLTNSNFEKLLKEKFNQPKNTTREESLKYIKQRAFTDLSGLGNKVTGKLQNKILTTSIQDRRKKEKQIKKLTKKAVKENQTTQQLASELRNETKDWARDFSRIADFVMQEAYGFGRAQQILEDYGDDAKVYKQTFPGVCDDCIRNYGAPTDKPKIYKLSYLLENGNNIGRKTQIPVAGNAHPFARSILHVVPPNSEWNNDKRQFEVKRNKQGVKRNSKVNVKIT